MSASVIVAGARTPIGKLLGGLKDKTAAELGGVAIAGALEKAGVSGDQVDYLDLVFRCTWLSGEPRPVDGEMTEVGWYDLDALPELELPDMYRRIALARAEGPAHFEGGR